jgi:L-fuconolactonase
MWSSLAAERNAHCDAHQHFWFYNAAEYDWIDDSMQLSRRDFLPIDLQPELVDLRSPRVRADFESFASSKSKLVGIRRVVQAEPDERCLLQPEFVRGITLLEDLAYDILIYAKHLLIAAEFVERFRRQRFVLDHLAKPPIKCGELAAWERGIRKLASFSNVNCKLSGLVTRADWRKWNLEHIKPCLDVALECFGTSRLMIGSDWPVCTLAASYSRTMGVVKDYLAKRPAHERDAVLGGNAQRFWKLRI